MLNKSTIVPFVDLSDQKLRDHDDRLLEDDDSSAFESLDDEETTTPEPKQISPEIESILIPKPVIKPAKKRVRILLPRQEDPKPIIAKKSIKITDDDDSDEDFSSLGRNYGPTKPSKSTELAEKLALLEEERKVLQDSLMHAQAKEIEETTPRNYDEEVAEQYADDKDQLRKDKEHCLDAECRLVYYYQIMALHNEDVIKRLEADIKTERDDNRIRALARFREQFTE